MADPENYKSISLDLDTYNLLKTVSEAECRNPHRQKMGNSTSDKL